MTLLVFALVLLASTLHASWNFAAKRVAGDLGVMWLGICVASVVSWSWALAVHQPAEVTLTAGLYIVATGLIHACYFGLLAKAYAAGDISLVYPVARGTGVAGTVLMAWALLHESLSLTDAIGIGAICLGTGLLGWRSGRARGALSGYLYALLVGVTIVGYSVVDKLGVGWVHPVAYISGMFTVCGLILMPHVLWRQRAACRAAWKGQKRYIGLIGLGSIGTYLIILFTFRMGPVSYIVAAREFAVVMGALLGFTVLKEELTHRKVWGIVAIMAGLVLVKLA